MMNLRSGIFIAITENSQANKSREIEVKFTRIANLAGFQQGTYGIKV